MEGLQRSTTSFRRQGSSGLIWDDKVLSGDLNQMKANNQENKESRGSSDGMMRRSRSDGGSGGHTYRTMKATSPSVDPPSPKVSGCGFCGVFGKPDAVKKGRPNKRKS
ncbi:MAPK SUBSTRATES IN THE STOMATAL LINEAGE 1 [Hibiscus trionum]|uniref:MAPK SUBSTRATES IN THE STOMATAL LINEAGE 1 n=1 Tax=Hibiscus trionum TaxID=183268 RepID=A0A9W7I947_HIBTR|nr:MAPK SUBSTRATES IN THE STOMATAL LINEAGE 1 [Hibiscus trionum]